MKLLIDIIPFACFYIAYQLYGFYIATAVIIVACTIQSILLWVMNRRLEKLQIVVLVLIWVFGGITLIFHDPLFLQYKVSVLYWIMSALFFYTQFFSKQKALEFVLKEQILLPDTVWKNLNLSWGLFFAAMGALNLYVVYHFSMSAWVNFKMFGTLGLTFIFVLLQSIYMAKYAKEVPTNDNNEKLT